MECLEILGNRLYSLNYELYSWCVNQRNNFFSISSKHYDILYYIGVFSKKVENVAQI